MVSSASGGDTTQGVAGVQEPPSSIELPAWFIVHFDDLVVRFAAKTGESQAEVRRGLELAVLARGIEAIGKELL